MNSIKTVLFILILSLNALPSNAQSALITLKLEEAETSFNKKDYKTTIEKLDQLDELIGVMSKTLYLRIVSQYNLLISDPYKEELQFDLLVSLRENTNAYLEAMESYELDNKFREVYRINEDLKRFPETNHNWLTPLSLEAKDIAQSKAKYYDSIFYGWKESIENGISSNLILTIPSFHNKSDFDDAINWYKEIGEKGKTEAFTIIGYIYQIWGGQFIGNDRVEEAISWYKKSSEKGEIYAMILLGNLYENEFSVKNTNEAISLYIKVAELGEPIGMLALGKLYYYGSKGITKDYLQALIWLRKTYEITSNAQLKYSAKYIIWRIYDEGGFGVKKNKELAKEWHNKK